MKYIKRIIIAVLYMLICLFSYEIGKSCGVKKGIEDSKITINNLPSIETIQEILGVKTDGKLGKETQIKWDEAVNMTVFNGYASEYFTNNGAPRK